MKARNLRKTFYVASGSNIEILVILQRKSLKRNLYGIHLTLLKCLKLIIKMGRTH